MTAASTTVTSTAASGGLRAVFWAALVAFLAWDFAASPAVDLRYEAPLIAAGSGKAIQGGHCAMPTGR